MYKTTNDKEQKVSSDGNGNKENGSISPIKFDSNSRDLDIEHQEKLGEELDVWDSEEARTNRESSEEEFKSERVGNSDDIRTIKESHPLCEEAHKRLEKVNRIRNDATKAETNRGKENKVNKSKANGNRKNGSSKNGDSKNESDTDNGPTKKIIDEAENRKKIQSYLVESSRIERIADYNMWKAGVPPRSRRNSERSSSRKSSYNSRSSSCQNSIKSDNLEKLNDDSEGNDLTEDENNKSASENKIKTSFDDEENQTESDSRRGKFPSNFPHYMLSIVKDLKERYPLTRKITYQDFEYCWEPVHPNTYLTKLVVRRRRDSSLLRLFHDQDFVMPHFPGTLAKEEKNEEVVGKKRKTSYTDQSRKSTDSSKRMKYAYYDLQKNIGAALQIRTKDHNIEPVDKKGERPLFIVNKRRVDPKVFLGLSDLEESRLPVPVIKEMIRRKTEKILEEQKNPQIRFKPRPTKSNVDPATLHLPSGRSYGRTYTHCVGCDAKNREPRPIPKVPESRVLPIPLLPGQPPIMQTDYSKRLPMLIDKELYKLNFYRQKFRTVDRSTDPAFFYEYKYK
ncbi:unnamed protein product [Ceutorhynchus assimilis]|uniref:Uncharacterized protein n=1 Tax=Ceutorhynchus assimilis TaxID=467358 RepID=A0A9P0DKJ8_9CUCU|nr:unnamed protein product [Ceutorhynchus assimilis]